MTLLKLASARTFASLQHHRNYRLFFAGQLTSVAGTWMQNIALAWVVVQVAPHSRGVALGILSVCRFGPFTVLDTFWQRGSVIVSPVGDGPAQVSDTVSAPAPAAASRVVVEARKLDKAYGTAPVLKGVDLELRSGRLHAVTGPSGSGKTTLLHLLAGLELPDAGTVRVGDADLTALDRTARAAVRRERIAYVGQQAGLVPHLSALENVELGLALRGREDGRIDALAALDSVGLGERATQRVARLSHGERARVGIARAIVSKPALLLADEPTSRLDGANAVSVAILLAQLARSTGAAVACATHDPLVIEQAESQISLS